MQTKEIHIQKLESQLKEFDAEINLLAAKMESAETDAKLKFAQELDGLRKKQNDASKKIDALQNTSDDTWEKVKANADQVWRDLRIGVTRITTKWKHKHR